MEKVIKDAIQCLNVINNAYVNDPYIGKLYKNTNEDLTTILTNYDLKNKNILSVLASSDQLFSCYYLGAKNVDTFDSNRLTYYFFFLKKWAILNGKTSIPSSNQGILELIEHHENTPEEINAYYFWKYVLLNIDTSLANSSLFYHEVNYHLPYFNNTHNLAKMIQHKSPNYNQFNLFQPIQYIPKKYQIIILSNILEYLYDNIENNQYQEVAAKNIYHLLEDDGIAISSNIIDYHYQGNDIFESYFEYREGPLSTDDIEQYPICYCYKKK